MKLSSETISELQNIFGKDYGVLLSLEETEEAGLSLLNIFEILLEESGKNDNK